MDKLANRAKSLTEKRAGSKKLIIHLKEQRGTLKEQVKELQADKILQENAIKESELQEQEVLKLSKSLLVKKRARIADLEKEKAELETEKTELETRVEKQMKQKETADDEVRRMEGVEQDLKTRIGSLEYGFSQERKMVNNLLKIVSRY